MTRGSVRALVTPSGLSPRPVSAHYGARLRARYWCEDNEASRVSTGARTGNPRPRGSRWRDPGPRCRGRPARRAARAARADVPPPFELRIQQAMPIVEVDPATARWRQATEDMAATRTCASCYGLDPEDPR